MNLQALGNSSFFLDTSTVDHFLVGFLLAYLSAPLWASLTLALGWEAFEYALAIKYAPWAPPGLLHDAQFINAGNALFDVLALTLGWATYHAGAHIRARHANATGASA